MISSFFSQSPKSSTKTVHPRPDSPIDLTTEDERPPAKKRRVPSDRPSINIASSSRVSGPSEVEFSEVAAVNQYRFRSTSIERPQDGAREAVRKQRHDRLKKLLLSDNNVFVREHVELEGQDTPEDEDDDEGGDAEAAQDDEDSDNGFSKLMEVFRNTNTKSKGKKGALKQKAVRKVQEMGPSGQPYTALELQVRQINRTL